MLHYMLILTSILDIIDILYAQYEPTQQRW